MIKRISGFVLAAALLLGVPVYAQTAEVQSAGDRPYKSVRLTPEIYRGANADLSDLRVQNSAGKDIPYFIHAGELSRTQQSERYPMELLDAYTKDDAFYFDYALAEMPDGDALSTSLVLETRSPNFAKDVTLFGSHDNRHWEHVQDDVLYSVEGKSKLEIVFAATQKYTHYRLRLANNLEKLTFDSVMLQYDQTETAQAYFRERLRPSFTTEEVGQDTLIHIGELKNLRLTDITLETDSMFLRRVTDPFGGSKELYNLSFERVAYQDTVLTLDQTRSSEETLTLKIINHDDAPISIAGVSVGYCADEIVFAAGTEQSFTLRFGDPAATAPVYDIASYKDQILQEGVDRLPVGAVTLEQTPEPPKEPDYALIFNVVIFAIAALLGALILMRLRKQTK